MAIQHLADKEAFNTKINQLNIAASDSKKWINQNLQSSNKSGRFVRFLGTLLRAIGIDAFGHIRANKVAHKMFEFAKANKDYLDGDNAGKLLGVMTALNNKTHGQYSKTIEKSKLAIKGILQPGTAIAETTVPGGPPPPPPTDILSFDDWKKQKAANRKANHATVTTDDQEPEETTKKKQRTGNQMVQMDANFLEQQRIAREERAAAAKLEENQKPSSSDDESDTNVQTSSLRKTPGTLTRQDSSVNDHSQISSELADKFANLQ
jgi:hypothetical protein